MSLRLLTFVSVGLLMAALFVRTFIVLGLIVPVQVSAGSMAPTLLGPHRLASCDVCERTFPVSVDRGWPANRATCPNCGRRGIDVSREPLLPGDSIWIDRTAFTVRSPRRWEVVVFRCPTDAARLCVKRVIGLPGETIDLREGEVYVNGEVARPPPAVTTSWRAAGVRGPKPPAHAAGRSWTLGTDEYFVLGDNRRISADSRAWRTGPGLPRKLLVGRPLWPPR